MAIKTKTTLTWKERIMLVTTGRNNKGGFLWYSHGKICDIIEKAEGVRITLGRELIELVKKGYLVRAVKPRHLSSKVQYNGKEEYLYRQTGKPFKRGMPELTNNRAEQAHEIWRLHKKLPKWFRCMMLD